MSIALDRQKHEAFRGRVVEIGGRASDPEGRGVRALRIEVRLGRLSARPLGITVTDRYGFFHGAFGLPLDIAVGDYPQRMRVVDVPVRRVNAR